MKRSDGVGLGVTRPAVVDRGVPTEGTRGYAVGSLRLDRPPDTHVPGPRVTVGRRHGCHVTVPGERSVHDTHWTDVPLTAAVHISAGLLGPHRARLPRRRLDGRRLPRQRGPRRHARQLGQPRHVRQLGRVRPLRNPRPSGALGPRRHLSLRRERRRVARPSGHGTHDIPDRSHHVLSDGPQDLVNDRSRMHDVPADGPHDALRHGPHRNSRDRPHRIRRHRLDELPARRRHHVIDHAGGLDRPRVPRSRSKGTRSDRSRSRRPFRRVRASPAENPEDEQSTHHEQQPHHTAPGGSAQHARGGTGTGKCGC
ncbi:hypothetical protein [Streptomyces sp. JV178]|uniref:hypothetical protein n=1 Tax=Streptomyces sp. JV178 TaxID=858632 RepID=UPI0015D56869|nr:hypothetical protein [Streptomyces sp. JV178]